MCALSQADKHLQEPCPLEKTGFPAKTTEHQGLGMQFAVRLFSYFECKSGFHSQHWKTKHKEYINDGKSGVSKYGKFRS